MKKSDGSTASYYELPEGATELQHLISDRNMNAQIGEAFRACYRYGQASHSDMMRDAKKIRFYAQAEIERLEKLQGNTVAEPFPDTVLDLPTEGMTDPANWRAGDLVECVSSTEVYFSRGKVYPVTAIDNGSICPISIDHEDSPHVKKVSYSIETAGKHFRFHSRPSKVNEAEMSGAWIVHDGGPMPCDDLSKVEIQYEGDNTPIELNGEDVQWWRNLRFRML